VLSLNTCAFPVLLTYITKPNLHIYSIYTVHLPRE